MCRFPAGSDRRCRPGRAAGVGAGVGALGGESSPQADDDEHEERHEPAAIETHAHLTGAKGTSTVPRRPAVVQSADAWHRSAARARRPRREARSIWIDRPWIDLLIGCGGWSIPLLALSYTLVDRDVPRWSAVFYGLALVCNYPHYMATIYRAYGRDDRGAHRLYTHWLTGGARRCSASPRTPGSRSCRGSSPPT